MKQGDAQTELNRTSKPQNQHPAIPKLICQLQLEKVVWHEFQVDV
jgi:hypothetical protein